MIKIAKSTIIALLLTTSLLASSCTKPNEFILGLNNLPVVTVSPSSTTAVLPTITSMTTVIPAPTVITPTIVPTLQITPSPTVETTTTAEPTKKTEPTATPKPTAKPTSKPAPTVTSSPTSSPAPTVTPSPSAAPTISPDPAIVDQWRSELFRLTNIEREKAGLPLLQPASHALQQAAAVRADEIVSLFDHTRPDGQSCFTVLSDYSISYGTAGENIAEATAGYKTPAEVIKMWMDSKGHRANMLNPSFSSMGIGYAQGNGWEHFVQLFTG